MGVRAIFILVHLALLWCGASAALAQFGTPGSTNFRERIVGEVSGGGITIEAGDQVGAFFEDEIVGVFTFNSDSAAFEVTLFGDNPATEAVEGPGRGQRVTFRYFDSSTNQTLDMTVLNQQGEAFNFTFQGVEVFEVPGLPIDLTPTRNFDLRIGEVSGGGGNGGGNNGGGVAQPGGGSDINGDDVIDVRDAAIVLRCMGGAVRPGTRAFRDMGISVRDEDGNVRHGGDGIVLSADELVARCDVDGDGSVTSRDAVAILRNTRPSPERSQP